MNDVVYKGFRRNEMEGHFNPKVAAPDFAIFQEKRAKASAAARQDVRSYLKVPYGRSPREFVDIFPAPVSSAPVQLYMHGGYWCGGSTADNAYIAGTFTRMGITVVLLEHDLCPTVTVTDIVRQARAGIAWVYRNIADYGGDPSRLYISGSSAGGHLVAMALAHDWEKAEDLPRDMIKGAVAITGVYDLEPVMHITVNDQVRLTPETARENSPMLNPPLPNTFVVIAVGQDESPGWRQMSADFLTLCRTRGVDCQYLEIPGVHHFSISSLLGDSASQLSRALLSQMGL
jgi:arylformamidase